MGPVRPIDLDLFTTESGGDLDDRPEFDVDDGADVEDFDGPDDGDVEDFDADDFDDEGDAPEYFVPLLATAVTGPFAETDDAGRPVLELCERVPRKKNGRRYMADTRIDSLTHDTTWGDLAEDDDLAGDYTIQVRGADGRILPGGKKTLRIPGRTRVGRGRIGHARKAAEPAAAPSADPALASELAARRQETQRLAAEMEKSRAAHFAELMDQRKRAAEELDAQATRHRKELAEVEARYRREIERLQADADRRLQRMREDLDGADRRAREADDRARELREQSMALRMEVLEAKSAGEHALSSLTTARQDAPPEVDELIEQQVDRLQRVMGAIGKAGSLLSMFGGKS